MRIVTTVALVFTVMGLVLWTYAAERSPASERVPVLVELFTSEGCSSCPPADTFLQALDRQIIPGTQTIVLSEHVDYWNHLGWRDPYSSRFYSDRQSAYARRFGLDGPYTPQMVVDGAREFVGSDRRQAEKAFAEVVNAPKLAVHLSNLALRPDGTLQAHVETASLPASQKPAEVYVVVALNHAQSQVARGENAGHSLNHVAVALNVTQVGTVRSGRAFSQDFHLKLTPGLDPTNLRVVAFLQEPGLGRILGTGAELIHP